VQDFTVFGGALSEMHARKICKARPALSFNMQKAFDVCRNMVNRKRVAALAIGPGRTAIDRSGRTAAACAR
jgi:hypothetical protein